MAWAARIGQPEAGARFYQVPRVARRKGFEEAGCRDE
jgi:hypothetical protein